MNLETLKSNVEQATKISISKFADFSGRSSRPEYWYFMLPVILMLAVLSILDSILFGGSPVLGLVAALATLVPTLSAGARRLHDTGRSGWWLLVALVPVIGGLVVLYLCSQPGNSGQNQFGPEPTSASFGTLVQA